MRKQTIWNRLFFGALIMTLWLPAFIFGQSVPEIDWDALQETKPWEATEKWEPVPKKVMPGVFNAPPSDAVILFDGKDLESWHKPAYDYGASMEQVEAIIKVKATSPTFSAPEWQVKDGQLIVKPGGGAIETKEAFGDIQLHIEWLAPTDPGKEGQGYSNSGVFLMGLYEIQVLNSYDSQTYPNGQAGAVYKQHIPMVNASRPSGEWQYYDIVFERPRFDQDGKLVTPAYLTVFHNGVLIHNHVALEGPCVYIGKSYYVQHAEKLPLLLQDHGNLVRYRNIWVRPLE